MIGKDDFGFYVSDINDAYKQGDLYLGFMDQKDSSSAVDIIFWREEDCIQIADFFNTVEVNNPDNSAIAGLLKEINNILISKEPAMMEANLFLYPEIKTLQTLLFFHHPAFVSISPNLCLRYAYRSVTLRSDSMSLRAHDR